MEKLELKDLLNHVANDGFVMLSDKGKFNLDLEYPDGRENGLFKVINILIGETIEIEISRTDIDYSIGFIELDEILLVKRPLSYYGGSKTGGEVMQLLNCTLDQVYEIWNLDFEDITLDQVSYGTYKVMCKNKLDFNKLIPKGLAVNINTI